MKTRAVSQRNRGHAPRARGRGGQTQPEGEASAATAILATLPTPRIQWEGKDYLYRTNLLISYCRDNPDLRLKLFSDSTQDAIKQGRPRKQMSASKDKYFQQVSDYVFSSDHDSAIKDAHAVNPLHFVKTVKSRFAKLKNKYNDFNKQLGLSGAGVTVEQMLEDPSKQNLLQRLRPTFPWWDDLHGWWKDNPAFNQAFSTADPGQDFVAEAEEFFSPSTVRTVVAPAGDDWTAAEEAREEGVGDQDLLEDVIGGTQSGHLEIDQDDAMLADPQDLSAPKVPSHPLDLPLNTTTGGHEMEDIVSTFSAHVERVTVSSSASAVVKGKQKAISPPDQSPRSHIPQSMVASSSHISSDPIALSASRPPTSGASSRISPASNTSSSRKRPRDITERTSDLLGDKNESLLNIIRGGLASQDESKRLKYDSIVTAKELRIREKRDKREHDLRLLMTQQTHEELVAAQNAKNLEVQKEIEELRLKRILALAAIQSAGHGSGSEVDDELKKALADLGMDKN